MNTKTGVIGIQPFTPDLSAMKAEMVVKVYIQGAGTQAKGLKLYFISASSYLFCLYNELPIL